MNWMISIFKMQIKKILVFILGVLVKRRTDCVFFIPNDLALTEPISINNFTADNVLFFLHYMLTAKDFNEAIFKNIYVVGLNDFIIKECIDFSHILKNIDLTVVTPYNNKKFLNFVKYLCIYAKCSIVINSDPMVSPLKFKDQTIVCLPYYPAPFKSDITRSYSKKHSTIDYAIYTSDFAARMDLAASHIPYNNYKILGFMKHDNIIYPRYTKLEIKKMLHIRHEIKKIVLYTPTHRDNLMSDDYDVIIGCKNFKDINELLIRNDAVLILRCHSGLDPKFLNQKIAQYSNVILYENSNLYTLLDIFPHADLLISDYSSAYFDFLLTNKPVIFNFFDIESYKKTRGLSYDPINLICSGALAYNYDQLLEYLEYYLRSNYTPDEYYNLIKQVFIKYTDGRTCERVYDFFQNILMGK